MSLVNKKARQEIATSKKVAKEAEKASNLKMEDDQRCPETGEPMTKVIGGFGLPMYVNLKSRIALPATNDVNE